MEAQHRSEDLERTLHIKMTHLKTLEVKENSKDVEIEHLQRRLEVK